MRTSIATGQPEDRRGSVIAAIDGSGESASAAAWATRFARAAGLEVVTAHVVTGATLFGGFVSSVPSTEVDPLAWLVDLDQTLGNSGAAGAEYWRRAPIPHHLLLGRDAVSPLDRFATAIASPLLVVHRPRSGGMGAITFASAVVSLVRRSHLSVAIIDQHVGGGPVLAAYDGGASIAAVSAASRLVHLGFGNAVAVTTAERMPLGMSSNAVTVQARIETLYADASTCAGDLCRQGVSASAGVYTTRLAASDALVEAARELNSSMIVVAARTNVPSTCRRTSESLIRHAPCSVLVVPETLCVETWAAPPAAVVRPGPPAAA